MAKSKKTKTRKTRTRTTKRSVRSAAEKTRRTTAKRAKARKRKSAPKRSPPAITPAARPLAEGVQRRGGCLDIVAATDVVIDALEGKPFEPQTKLQTIYLSQLERDLFRDRVAAAVERRGCSIGLGDIPNSGGTKQIDVRNAVEESAS
jgi:hypothetical protein